MRWFLSPWQRSCFIGPQAGGESMKWQRGYRSSDVDDRRGAGMGLSSGLFGPLVAIGSRFGIVGIVAAVALYFAARAFFATGTPMSATSPSTQGRPAVTSGQDETM